RRERRPAYPTARLPPGFALPVQLLFGYAAQAWAYRGSVGFGTRALSLLTLEFELLQGTGRGLWQKVIQLIQSVEHAQGCYQVFHLAAARHQLTIALGGYAYLISHLLLGDIAQQPQPLQAVAQLGGDSGVGHSLVVHKGKYSSFIHLKMEFGVNIYLYFLFFNKMGNLLLNIIYFIINRLKITH